ncbi:MAG TPA: class II fumarate hydratase [Desulfobacteraceae bacterium]|nr:class II fumarate hydratase [Desulfobacteraceae bacterium]
MTYRIEHDTMGEVRVPAERLWGAQTQRSLNNFRIGAEKMPKRLIYAFARLKKACPTANHHFGKLDEARSQCIVKVCDEILAGRHDEEFPLSVWQTGSGTQTNMNLNEVIANRANLLRGEEVPESPPVHPNDHVNMSQSSNDTFPTAMHVAAVTDIEEHLLPAVAALAATLHLKAEQYSHIIKIGRTHLQDATPLTLGQEISGWAAMLDNSRDQISRSLEPLRALAIGGTAVGTGLNAPAGFGPLVAEHLTRQTGRKFVSAPNKFHALTSHDALVWASGALKSLAANLMKIANDIRWLASGPRCGIGELTIPANEPDSSIMPGKVNPTQAEAVTMVACQVFANDTAVAFGASQGNFELNVFEPVIIHNFLQSTRLLTDVIHSFNTNCAAGLEPVPEKIAHNLNNSLMLVTALNQHVGYEKAALIAKTAYSGNITLKEAALRLGLLTAEEFDRQVDPGKMVHPEN